MISISERLRARQEPVGDGSGKWRKDGLCQEAADTIDALVEALEEAKDHIRGVTGSDDRPGSDSASVVRQAEDALAKAKGKQE